MRLSIIIPAYNEETRIGRTLEDYISFYNMIYGDDFEIIVVTDGCNDKTCDVINSFEGKIVKNFNFKIRLGKGGAISRGLRKSEGDIVAYTDADGSTAPKQLYDLIQILEIINCDGVSASRYAAGSRRLVTQSFSRWFASRSFNLMVRTLFFLPYRDTQCGAKAFKKEVAREVFSKLTVTDWAFDVNLLYNARKAKFDIREIPIFWKDTENSKLNMKRIIPQMFLSLIRLRLLESPFSFAMTNPVVRRIGSILKKTGVKRK